MNIQTKELLHQAKQLPPQDTAQLLVALYQHYQQTTEQPSNRVLFDLDVFFARSEKGYVSELIYTEFESEEDDDDEMDWTIEKKEVGRGMNFYYNNKLYLDEHWQQNAKGQVKTHTMFTFSEGVYQEVCCKKYYNERPVTWDYDLAPEIQRFLAE
jgi:hypothetical protein